MNLRLKIQRPMSKLGKKRRKKINTIKAKSFKILYQLIKSLGVIWLTFLQKSLDFKKILIRLHVIIVAKKDIMQLNILNHLSQKTSIDLGNFCISNWY